jgi:hypothetical protein
MTFLYQDHGQRLFVSRTAIKGGRDKEWEMLYMSNATVSRRARRLAYANRPYESIDNPVKRYLGSKRLVGKGLRTKGFRRVLGSRLLRPAF